MYRDIRPAVPHATQSGTSARQDNEEDEDQTASGKSQRKAVTSIACTSCRTRRIKCDGVKPVCGACATKNRTDCEYDINRASRRMDVLRTRIAELESEVFHWRKSSKDSTPSDGLRRPFGQSASIAQDGDDGDGDWTPDGAAGDGDDTMSDNASLDTGSRATYATSVTIPDSMRNTSKRPYVALSDADRQRQQGGRLKQLGLSLPSDLRPDAADSSTRGTSHSESVRSAAQQFPILTSYRIPEIGPSMLLYGDLSPIRALPQATPIDNIESLLLPMHLVQPLNFNDDEVLSRLYSSFLVHQRRVAVEYRSPAQQWDDAMNVALLLPNPHNTPSVWKVDAVTAFIADFLATFGQHKLPEQVGIMHLLYRLIRWQISPTYANHQAIPIGMRPSPLQRSCPHPAWIEFVIWPDVRDAFIADPSLRNYDGGSCMPILMATMNAHWPGSLSETVVEDPATGHWHMTRTFQAHCEDPNNWSVGSELISQFPGLVGRVRIDDTKSGGAVDIVEKLGSSGAGMHVLSARDGARDGVRDGADGTPSSRSS